MRRAAHQTIKTLTRIRFGLDDDAAVVVAETACALEGHPPLQTVVVFWSIDQTRRRFRVLKPMSEVEIDDLPPAWLEQALASFERPEGGCC